MSELPREFIARYTAGGAVGIASVCSAHPEILINRLHFLSFTFAQVLAPKVIKRSAAGDKNHCFGSGAREGPLGASGVFFRGCRWLVTMMLIIGSAQTSCSKTAF
jgi:hypothetical protein